MGSGLKMGLVTLAFAVAAVAGALAFAESPGIIAHTAEQMLATGAMIMPGG